MLLYKIYVYFGFNLCVVTIHTMLSAVMLCLSVIDTVCLIKSLLCMKYSAFRLVGFLGFVLRLILLVLLKIVWLLLH